MSSHPRRNVLKMACAVLGLGSLKIHADSAFAVVEPKPWQVLLITAAGCGPEPLTGSDSLIYFGSEFSKLKQCRLTEADCMDFSALKFAVGNLRRTRIVSVTDERTSLLLYALMGGFSAIYRHESRHKRGAVNPQDRMALAGLVTGVDGYIRNTSSPDYLVCLIVDV